MRRIRAKLVVAALLACAASPQDPKPQPSKASEFEALAASWLSSDQTDADAKARVVDAMLAQREDAFPWLRNQLRAATDVASPSAKGLRSLLTDVVLGFVEQQRRSGVVYRGQYLALQELQPFAAELLFELLLRTPDWLADTRRVHLVPALADLQKTQPEPSALLGVVDLVEDVEIEPADLRNALAALLWQWGRKEHVEARARALRDQSGEGDAEDRVLAFRELGDLWYRVQEHKRAAAAHASLAALADSANLELLPTDWYWGACYNALAGKIDAGFAALNRCAELHASDRVDIVRKLPHALWQIDPDLAALRADARFAAVLKRAFPDAQGEGKQEQKGAR